MENRLQKYQQNRDFIKMLILNKHIDEKLVE